MNPLGWPTFVVSSDHYFHAFCPYKTELMDYSLGWPNGSWTVYLVPCLDRLLVLLFGPLAIIIFLFSSQDHNMIMESGERSTSPKKITRKIPSSFSHDVLLFNFWPCASNTFKIHWHRGFHFFTALWLWWILYNLTMQELLLKGLSLLLLFGQCPS